MPRSHLRVGRFAAFASISLLTVAAGIIGGSGIGSAAPAPLQTRYVATTGSDGVEPLNDCLDPAAPCLTIQHAVDESFSGDTINVDAGDYPENVTVGTLDLTIVGSTTGVTKILVPDVLPDGEVFFNVSSGILVGNPDLVTDEGSEEPPEITQSVVLKNLTVETAGSTQTQTAGVIAVAAQVSIMNSVFSGNFVGVAGFASIFTISDSSISDSPLYGAYSVLGSLTINRSSVTGSQSGQGFGVMSQGSDTEISDSTVTGNDVGVGYFEEGQFDPSTTIDNPGLSIQRSTIANNSVVGVFNSGGGAVIDNSTISGNTGAGVFAAQGTTDINNSTIAGTKAVASGEGNSMFGDNSGAIVVDSAMTREQSVGKSAAGSLDGLPQFSDLFAGTPQLDSGESSSQARLAPVGEPGVNISGTIIADNEVPDCSGVVTDVGYNLSQDAENSCALSEVTSITGVDPLLEALSDNGGPTQTRSLRLGSPALDAIAIGQAGCVADATDQRGVARPQSLQCDIGAFELEVAPIIISPVSLPNGTTGTPYRAPLTATGGPTTEYSWTLAPESALPPGLVLSGDGVISGAPTDAGTFSFTVVVNGVAQQTYSLVIDPAAVNPSQPNEPAGPPAGPGMMPGGGNGVAPIGPPAAGPMLANTGLPVQPLILIALATLLAGGALIRVGTRGPSGRSRTY